MSGPIILPTDFSELSAGAVEWAKRMASTMDADIHCVYVVNDVALYSGAEFLAAPIPATKDLEERAAKQLEEFVASNDLGDATSAVVSGAPFVEIIRYARAAEASMIVMSTHGHTGLKHVLLGSTTEAVVRKAGCPVLSVPAPGVSFELP